MRKLERMVLSQLAKKELNQRQMSKIKGGGNCSCGCCYAGEAGGSSSFENRDANCALNTTTLCPVAIFTGSMSWC